MLHTRWARRRGRRSGWSSGGRSRSAARSGARAGSTRLVTALSSCGAALVRARRSARLPPAILHQVHMRLIGVAVVVAIGLILAPLVAAPRPAFLSATAWASLRH